MAFSDRETRRVASATLRYVRIAHKTGAMGRRNTLVPGIEDAEHSALLERLLNSQEPETTPTDEELGLEEPTEEPAEETL